MKHFELHDAKPGQLYKRVGLGTRFYGLDLEIAKEAIEKGDIILILSEADINLRCKIVTPKGTLGLCLVPDDLYVLVVE